MARYGTFAIPQNLKAFWFYGTIDRSGSPQAPYPPGQAIAASPWYELGQIAVRHLPGINSEAQDITRDFFTVGSSATFAALAGGCAFLTFLRLGLAPARSLAAGTILALATPIAAYSGWFFSEPLASMLLLAAAAMLFARPVCERVSWSAGAISGLFLGASIWVRPTHILAVPIFFVAILVRDGYSGTKSASFLCIVAAVLTGGLLWRNVYLFGSPLEFGYPRFVNGKELNSFHTSLLTGLAGFLFSPGKSIFLYSPPILLAIWGLPRMWLRDRGLAIVAAITPLVYLIFFAKYTQWEGGYCYGPRYLVPALALLGLGLGLKLDGASRTVKILAISFLLVGVGVQAIGLGTSFLEAEINGAYYDPEFNYRFNYSGIIFQTKNFLRYATSTQNSPIGLGFDRWWLFLAKAGVHSRTLVSIATVLLMGITISAWWLWYEWNRLRSRRSI